MADSDDNGKSDGEDFNAPGITDLPLRVTRAAAELLRGPSRILSSAILDLAEAAQELGQTAKTAPAPDTTKTDTGTHLGRTATSLTRAAGSAVIETARVVEDTAARFVSPSSASQPDMVMLDNRLYPRAPFLLEKTSVFAFFIKADESKMQDYLDTAFKTPTSGVFELIPACGHIITFVGVMDKTRSDAGATNETRKGYIKDDYDVAMWIPALQKKPTPRLCFVPVYHFVREAQTLAAGREIYGFPKQHSALTNQLKNIPQQGPAILPMGTLFELSTEALAKLNDPNVESKSELILAIENPQAELSWSSKALDIEQMFRDVIEACEKYTMLFTTISAKTVDDVLKLLGIDIQPNRFTGSIPMLFLKQVPDAADSAKCAYQAVVEANMTVKTAYVRGLGDAQQLTATFYGPGKTAGKNYPTHPFENLGIDVANPKVSHRVFWMLCDLRIENGKVVWQWP